MLSSPRRLKFWSQRAEQISARIVHDAARVNSDPNQKARTSRVVELSTIAGRIPNLQTALQCESQSDSGPTDARGMKH